ncbi:phage tail protein [Pseudomonas ovata]|uniref:phage tail protein n=1 Tax=Pseudomonas ovata TaxID=1839709 RepID=UPI000D68F2D5|nr:tail fiber protein [Pseudomonas ovata]
MADPFIGEIRMLASNYAPRGFLMCDGQQLPLMQNQALFALIGTVYGGNGQTTFALPDFRGRSPIGWGQGAGLSMHDIGEAAGTENVTQLVANMPTHNPVVAITANATSLPGVNTNQVVNAIATSDTPIAGGCLGIVNDGAGTNYPAYHSGKDNTGADLPRVDLATTPVTSTGPVTAAGVISTSGGSMPISVMNPYLAVSFVIATQGIYPTRD